MITGKERSCKKKAKYFAIICTAIYVLLLPFAAYGALLSPMVFDKPSMTISIGFILMFLIGCIPLSMLISIWNMWTKYSKEQYSSVHFFCFLPLFTFGAVFLLNALLHTLFL
jgi:hypothetical protein